MHFLTFIFGLLIVIALVIFVRVGFYIYSLLIYKTERTRSSISKRDSSSRNEMNPIHSIALPLPVIDAEPTAVVVETPVGHEASPMTRGREDSIVSQVVLRQGKLVVLNYSMTDEFKLVKKASGSHKHPSAPPLEMMDDDEPPSYEACVSHYS